MKVISQFSFDFDTVVIPSINEFIRMIHSNERGINEKTRVEQCLTLFINNRENGVSWDELLIFHPKDKYTNPEKAAVVLISRIARRLHKVKLQDRKSVV